MSDGFVLEHKQTVAQFVGNGLNIKICEPYEAIGYVRDEVLISGCVFYEYNGANVSLTIYSTGGLPRLFMQAIWIVCFDQYKATRASLTIKRSNKRVLKMAEKFGFKYEGVRPRWYGATKSEDGIMFGFLPHYSAPFMKGSTHG